MVGDLVQIQKRLLIRKDDGAKLFALQCAVFYSAGKPRFDGRKQGSICFQQLMVNGITIQHHTTKLPDHIQKGGFAAAGATGDSDDHRKSSALMIWKAAAFFSRFCTA